MTSWLSLRLASLPLLMLVGFSRVFAQDANVVTASLGERLEQSTALYSTPQQNQTPPNRQSIVPLTSRQKFARAGRKGFLTAGAYLSPAVNAFFIERNDVKAPGKTAEDKFADGLSYYARTFATRSTSTVLGDGLFPVLFKQDPRYYPSGKRGYLSRTLYAASRTVITRGDNGKAQVNYSKLAGTLTSQALANIYERDTVKSRDANGRVLSYHRRVGVRPTLVHFGVSTAMSAATNVILREFDLPGKLLEVLGKR
jgi:hypothetical protein